MPQLDQDDPAVRIAVLGKQVEDFLQSDLGNYLLNMAREEEIQAIEELITCVAMPEIEQARARIWRARSFQLWLGEAVERGLQAIALMKENDNA